MTATAETTRRASSGRRGSMEDQSLASSTGSRLSSTEISAVSNTSTRRLLENMDEEQIGKAMEGLKVVRQKRRESAKRTNSITRVSAEASAMAMADDTNEESAGETSSKTDNNASDDPDNVTSNDGDDDACDAGQLDAIPPLPDFGKKKTNNTDSSALPLPKTSPHNDGRRMSKSLGALAGIGDHDFSQYVSDSDSDEDGSPNDRNGGSTPPEHFKHMDRGLTKLHEGVDEDRDDDTDVDSENVAKKEFDPAPVRRVRTQRRTAMAKSVGPGTSHSQWKPLSTPTVDEDNDDDEGQEKAKEETKPEAGGGLGGLWNTFKKSLSGDSYQDALQETTKPKPDGAKFFRRGKRRAEKCQFLEAVALFNFALINQREELGKNHIDCGRTLNEIGLCWLMMGERYPAMTAFEEALFIFQHNLGDGAQEVAEVTNNIWMLLHEQREEALNVE